MYQFESSPIEADFWKVVLAIRGQTGAFPKVMRGAGKTLLSFTTVGRSPLWEHIGAKPVLDRTIPFGIIYFTEERDT